MTYAEALAITAGFQIYRDELVVEAAKAIIDAPLAKSWEVACARHALAVVRKKLWQKENETN